jgi:hypothetical protein
MPADQALRQAAASAAFEALISAARGGALVCCAGGVRVRFTAGFGVSRPSCLRFDAGKQDDGAVLDAFRRKTIGAIGFTGRRRDEARHGRVCLCEFLFGRGQARCAGERFEAPPRDAPGVPEFNRFREPDRPGYKRGARTGAAPRIAPSAKAARIVPVKPRCSLHIAVRPTLVAIISFPLLVFPRPVRNRIPASMNSGRACPPPLPCGFYV